MNNILWLATVVGLPVALAWRVFANEPPKRHFMASWVLSVVGVQVIFFGFVLTLTLAGISPFGMFEGFILLPVSAVTATIIGLVVRKQRQSSLES
ncbi:hypothetical protein [Blastomonas sp. UPD001]|uniref:hypothetical protein n=1 Tax=Blastomonas sp. UPD001 TaxID=2217673 RepID=UPI000E34BD64|nr:hypothetical protein [Blastomonas sp. UPD001]